MPNKKVSDEKEQYWQEIFDEVEMEFLPIEYVSRIIIKFQDNTTWDINVDDSRKKQPIEQIEDSLEQLFEEYDHVIETIDFRLDLERIKHDLGKRVSKFLKLNK